MHPKDVEVMHVISVDRLDDLWSVINVILDIYRKHNTLSVRVLIPKDRSNKDDNIARKIIHKLLNEVNIAVRRLGYSDSIRYIIYHHNETSYGILLLDSNTADTLGMIN